MFWLAEEYPSSDNIWCDENLVESGYHDRKERLVFVQSGVKIKFLYNLLFKEGLTLSTSPSTDGATGIHCDDSQSLLLHSCTIRPQLTHLPSPKFHLFISWWCNLNRIAQCSCNRRSDARYCAWNSFGLTREDSLCTKGVNWSKLEVNHDANMLP